MLEGECHRHVLAALTDDNTEFDFLIRLLRSHRNLHVIVRSNDRTRGFEEEDGLGWDRYIGFDGMISIVETHANPAVSNQTCACSEFKVQLLEKVLGNAVSGTLRYAEFVR
jgi:hypothetical protein